MMQQPLKPLDQIGARRRAPGGKKQKYFLTPETRQIIVQKYDGSSERIDELQKILRVPRHIVIRWASEMGLTRPVRGDKWSAEEMAFLRKNINKMQIIDIAEELGKSPNNVRKKALRLGLTKTSRNDDGYTLADLQMGFGMTHSSTILGWIERGWLKGRRCRSHVAVVTWQFKAKDIRDFIFAHPDELDPRRFDWLWIVDILSGDDGLGRLDEDKYQRKEME